VLWAYVHIVFIQRSPEGRIVRYCCLWTICAPS
jgi:hypothetical protein